MAQKTVSAQLYGVSALCFPGYIDITQQGMFLLFSWKFVSFMSEWIFMVSCNCHLCNPGIAVTRMDMILEDEALTHGRLLPKNSTFAEERVEHPRFFSLCFSSLSFPTDQC